MKSRANLAARLFSDPAPSHPDDVYTAQVDGASRGNPGPAAYAVIVRRPDGSVVYQLGKYLGNATNNVAEYFALITALDYCAEHNLSRLRVRSDSELLVRQMQGRYKVKSASLKPLHERALRQSKSFGYFVIEHVPRELNSEADALANAALDRTGEVRSAGGASNGSAAAAAPNSNARTIRAVFRNGALHPAETLELPDGAAVEITIKIQK
jgi:probable phosphoglycerate mutase